MVWTTVRRCPQLVDILGLVLPTNEQHIKIAACIKKTVLILSFSVKLALYFNYLRGCDIIHYIMLTKKKFDKFAATFFW